MPPIRARLSARLRSIVLVPALVLGVLSIAPLGCERSPQGRDAAVNSAPGSATQLPDAGEIPRWPVTPAAPARTIVVTSPVLLDAVRHIAFTRLPALRVELLGASPSADLLRSADLIIALDATLDPRPVPVPSGASPSVDRIGRIVRIGAPDPSRLITAVDAPAPGVHLDPALWAEMLPAIHAALVAIDGTTPDTIAPYDAGLERYRDRVSTLGQYSSKILGTIPSDPALIVSDEPSLEYLTRGAMIEFVTLPSRDRAVVRPELAPLAGRLAERRVPAIFAPPDHPWAAALAEMCRALGHELRLVPLAFVRTLGPEGTPESAYAGAIDATVRTIVAELQGSMPIRTFAATHPMPPLPPTPSVPGGTSGPDRAGPAAGR
jgi:ABC-type Zn uptake system ZnuABC Zn-binding protein ZnuA